MEPGTLELQVFVSLIVILGTAFVALVCDYLKGSKESLREHNVELRVRKEEQEKYEPLEAVEWLQQLLGAAQRKPIGFGGARPAPRRDGSSLAARHVRRQAAIPTAIQPVATPLAQPAAEVESEETPAVAGAAAADEQGRTGQAAAGPNSNSLLDRLPKPAWLQRQQDERAAARALRERREKDSKPLESPRSEERPEPAIEPLPTPSPVTGKAAEPVEGPEHKRHDAVWTYRSLLDRVVAATSGPEHVEEAVSTVAHPDLSGERAEAVESVFFTGALATVASTAPLQTVSMVAVDAAHAEGKCAVLVEPVASAQFLRTPSEPITRGAGQQEALAGPGEQAEPVDSTIALINDQESAQEKENMGSLTRYGVSEADDVAPEPRQLPPVVSMPSLPELRLPPGYHDRSVFTEHMHSTDVLTGVVAAIGINDYTLHSEKMGAGPMAELMRSVESMIAGTLRANIDFGCRLNDDEFILIFPNETGADAQNRLITISERLWNFQLRSLTNFSVFFSWGAVEVQGETLPDAAASASERMYQTKRNRKTLSIDAQRHRLAVNL